MQVDKMILLKSSVKSIVVIVKSIDLELIQFLCILCVPAPEAPKHCFVGKRILFSCVDFKCLLSSK